MSNELLYWHNLKSLWGYIICQFKGHPNPFKDFSYRCQRCHVHIYNGKERRFIA